MPTDKIVNLADLDKAEKDSKASAKKNQEDFYDNKPTGMLGAIKDIRRRQDAGEDIDEAAEMKKWRKGQGLPTTAPLEGRGIPQNQAARHKSKAQSNTQPYSNSSSNNTTEPNYPKKSFDFYNKVLDGSKPKEKEVPAFGGPLGDLVNGRKQMQRAMKSNAEYSASVGLSPAPMELKYGGAPMGANKNNYAATMQPWTEQALRAIAVGVPSGLLTAVEDLSYLGEAVGILDTVNQEDGERVNNIAKAMQVGKENIRAQAPIYSNDDGGFDSGWFWSGVSSLVDSGIGMAIPAGALGKAGKGLKLGKNLARVYGTLNKTAKVGALRNAYLIGNHATRFGTAFAMNYAESEMIGSEVYKATYTELRKAGYDHEEAANRANSEAESAARINKAFILDDLLMVGSISKGFTYSRNLVNKRTVGGMLKTYGKVSLAEGGQELIQGFLTSEALRSVRQDAYKEGMSKDLYVYNGNILRRALNYSTSKDGITNGLLGLVGGVTQKGMVDAISGMNKKAREQHDDYQKRQDEQIAANEELLKQNFNFLKTVETDKEQAILKNDKNEFDRADKRGFAKTAYSNFSRGTTEKLEESLKEIKELSKEEAEERGLGPDYKQQAEKYLKELPNLEYEYNLLVEKHNEDAVRPYHEEIFNATVESRLEEEAISDRYNEIQKLRSDITEQHLKKTGKTIESEKLDALIQYHKQKHAADIKEYLEAKKQLSTSESDKKQMDEVIKNLEPLWAAKLPAIPRSLQQYADYEKLETATKRHLTSSVTKDIHSIKLRDYTSPSWRNEVKKEAEDFAKELLNNSETLEDLEKLAELDIVKGSKSATQVLEKKKEEIEKKAKEKEKKKAVAEAKRKAEGEEDTEDEEGGKGESSFESVLAQQEELAKKKAAEEGGTDLGEAASLSPETRNGAAPNIADQIKTIVEKKKNGQPLTESEEAVAREHATIIDGVLEINETVEKAAKEVTELNKPLQETEEETTQRTLTPEFSNDLERALTTRRIEDTTITAFGVEGLEGLVYTMPAVHKNQPIQNGRRLVGHKKLKNGSVVADPMAEKAFKAISKLKEGDPIYLKALTYEEAVKANDEGGWGLTYNKLDYGTAANTVIVITDEAGNHVHYLQGPNTKDGFYKGWVSDANVRKTSPEFQKSIKERADNNKKAINAIRAFMTDPANAGKRIKTKVAFKHEGRPEHRNTYGAPYYQNGEGRTVKDTFGDGVIIAVRAGSGLKYANAQGAVIQDVGDEYTNELPEGTVVAITEENGKKVYSDLETKKIGDTKLAEDYEKVIGDLIVASMQFDENTVNDLIKSLPDFLFAGRNPYMSIGDGVITITDWSSGKEGKYTIFTTNKDGSAKSNVLIHYRDGDLDRHPGKADFVPHKNGTHQILEGDIDTIKAHLRKAIEGQYRQVDYMQAATDPDYRKNLINNSDTLIAKAITNVGVKENYGVTGGNMSFGVDASFVANTEENPVTPEPTTSEPTEPSDTTPADPDAKNAVNNFLFGNTLTSVQDTKPTAKERINQKEALANLEKTLPGMKGRIKFENSMVYGNKVLNGQFRDAMIFLSKAGHKGTEFHEAFHAVMHLYLTEQQRKEVYHEARVELKKRREDITDREAEEYVAEKFRKMMMNGGKDMPAKTTFIGKLFQDLMLWIDKLLGNKSYTDALFERIASRRFDKAPSEKAIKYAQNLTMDMEKPKSLSEIETVEAEDTLTYIIVNMQDQFEKEAMGNSLAAFKQQIAVVLGGKENQAENMKLTGKDLDEAYNVIKAAHGNAANMIKAYVKGVVEMQAVDAKGNTVDVWARVADDFELLYDKVLGRLEREYDIVIDEELSLEEEVLLSKDWDQSGFIKVSRKKDVNKRVKALIRKTPKLKKNGAVDVNFLGVPKRLNFDREFTFLAERLSGIPTLDGMLKKLNHLAKFEPSYKAIADLLNKEKKNADGDNLYRSAFYSSMRNQRLEQKTNIRKMFFRNGVSVKENRLLESTDMNSPRALLGSMLSNMVFDEANTFDAKAIDGAARGINKRLEAFVKGQKAPYDVSTFNAAFEGINSKGERMETKKGAPTQTIATLISKLANDLGIVFEQDGVDLVEKAIIEEARTIYEGSPSATGSKQEVATFLTNNVVNKILFIAKNKGTTPAELTSRAGDFKALAEVFQNQNFGVVENVFYTVDGDKAQTIVQPHFLSDFLDTLHSDNIIEVKAALKELLSDTKNAHSNLLRTVLGTGNFMDAKGKLQTVRNEDIDNLTREQLNMLKDISYSRLNGGIDYFSNTTANYGSMSDNDWVISSFTSFFYALNKREDNRKPLRNANDTVMASIPILIPSDSGNMSLMDFPMFRVGKEEGIYSAKRAMKNILYQERVKIAKNQAIFDRVFEMVLDDAGNVTGWNFDNVIDSDLEKELVQNVHFKEDGDGNRDYSNANGLRILPFAETISKDMEVARTANEALEAIMLDSNGRVNEGTMDEADVDAISEIMNEFSTVLKEETQEMLDKAAEEEANFDTTKVFKDQLDRNRTRIMDFALNNFIWNYEMANMFTGQIEFYKNAVDLNKRAKEIIAPGMQLDTTALGEFFNVATLKDIEIVSNSIDTIATSVINRMKEEGTVADSLDIDKYIAYKSTGEGKALKGYEAIDKIIGGYFEVNVADGQGYVTLDRYEKLVDALGELGAPMKKVIDKAKRGDKLSVDDIKKLQPQKFFYYGNVFDNKLGMRVPKQLKYSTVPLIPELVKGTPLERLKNRMEDPNNPIDEVVYESAFKVGRKVATKAHESFEGENGLLSVNALENLVPESLPNKYMRKQLDVPDHIVDTTNRLGTQLAKLAISNITDDMAYKVPRALYEKSKGGKQEWAKGQQAELTGAEVKKLFLNTISELVKESHKELQARITTDGKLDYKSLQKVLMEELKRKNASENYMEAIRIENGKFNMPLFYSAMSSLFEQNLTSLWTNTVTRQKMPGGSAVQVTDAFIQASDAEGGIDWSESWKKKKEKEGKPPKLSYNIVNGVLEVEALLPRWSKEFFDENGNPLPFDELFKKDKRLKTLIAYRIPTESKHSMVRVKVVGFAPDANGSHIIMPDEVTTQTGADFDVDKMFFMQYNMHRNEEGNLAVGFNEETQKTKQTLQNNLMSLVDTVLSHPEHLIESMAGQHFDDMKATSREEAALDSFTAEEISAHAEEKSMTIKEATADLLSKGVNAFSFKGQSTFRSRNTAGITLKGVAANYGSFGAIMQVTKATTSPFLVAYEAGEVDVKELQNRYGAHNVEEANGKVTVQLTQLGWSKDNKNIEGDNVLAHASQVLAAVLDIAKDPTFEPLNLDLFTLPTFSTMLLMGNSINYSGKWISQPAIKELRDIQNSKQGIFNRSGNFKLKTEVNNVLKNYLNEAYTAKLITIDDANALLAESDNGGYEAAIKKLTPFGELNFAPTKQELDFVKSIGTKLKKGVEVSNKDLKTYYNVSSASLMKFHTFNSTVQNVDKLVRSIKFDTMGAGPEIAKSRNAIDTLEEAVGNESVMIDGLPAVDAIFPSVALEVAEEEYSKALMQSDFPESKLEELKTRIETLSTHSSSYAPLETIYQHSNKDMLNTISNEFIQESDAFLNFIDSVMPPFVKARERESIVKKATDFGVSWVMSSHPMFSKEMLDTSLGLRESLTPEQRGALYNKGAEALSPEEYANLGLATKIRLIKGSPELLAKFPGLEYFRPLTGTDQVIEHKGVRHVDFMKEDNNPVLAEIVTNTIRNMYVSGDHFLQSVAEDFVKYSMGTTGMRFGAKSVANFLPISVLTDSNIQLNTYLYNRLNQMQNNPMAMAEARNVFLRNMSEEAEFSDKYKTPIDGSMITAEGIIYIDRSAKVKKKPILKAESIMSGKPYTDDILLIEDPAADSKKRKAYRITTALGTKSGSFKMIEFTPQTSILANQLDETHAALAGRTGYVTSTTEEAANTPIETEASPETVEIEDAESGNSTDFTDLLKMKGLLNEQNAAENKKKAEETEKKCKNRGKK